MPWTWTQIGIIFSIAVGIMILLFLLIVAFIFIKRSFGNIGLWRKRKKLLADDDLLRYCMERVNKGWSVAQVKQELMMARKPNEDRQLYSKARIKEVCYIYKIILKEMEEDKKEVNEDAVIKGKGRTENETSEALPS